MAASKTLFFLRPRLFVSWDEPMRVALGYRDGTREQYALFLDDVRALHEPIERLCLAEGYALADLPAKLGGRQQECTVPELINKALWARTR